MADESYGNENYDYSEIAGDSSDFEDLPDDFDINYNLSAEESGSNNQTSEEI